MKKWQPKFYQQSKKLIQHHNQAKTLATYESFWGIESDKKMTLLITTNDGSTSRQNLQPKNNATMDS